MTDARQERDWWDGLTGDEILNNTAGYPPYDACAVADIVVEQLGLTDMTEGTLLDLGCGTGRLTWKVAARCHPHINVYGVDVAPSLVEIANSKGAGETAGVYFRVGDGRTIHPAIRFSRAYSVTMFQHIPHEAKWDYIKTIWERLPAGGRFLFTVSVGDEPNQFLNYQIHDIRAFVVTMLSLFRKVDAWPDERGWTWVYAEKE